MARLPAESVDMTYSFASNKPWNSRIVPSDPSTYPIYSVKTETKDASSFFGSSYNVTEVVNELSSELIATLTWREVLPDKVTYRHSAPMSIKTWMKPRLNNHHAAFRDDAGRKYQWRNIAAGLDMELHAEDTPDTPIVTFTKDHNIPLGVNANLKLNLTKRATEIYELCVVSFIFLEKNRSLHATSSLLRADVAGKNGFQGKMSLF